MTSQHRIDSTLYRASVDISVICSFLDSAGIYIIPEISELRLCERLTIFVCNHIAGIGIRLCLTQTVHKVHGNGNITSGSFGFENCGDFRIVFLCPPCSLNGNIRCGCVQKNTVPLQRQDLLSAKAGV